MNRPSSERLREVLRAELHGAEVLVMTTRRKARCALCKARFYYEKPGARHPYDRDPRPKIQRRPLCAGTYCAKARRSGGNTCL